MTHIKRISLRKAAGEQNGATLEGINSILDTIFGFVMSLTSRKNKTCSTCEENGETAE